jgi:hypothetical protein
MAYTVHEGLPFLSSTAKYAIHVYGGIFAIPKYHDEMNLGIPGKDVVFARLMWSHLFM